MAAKENQFFIDSEYLSPEALAIKHRLETDPTSRKDHMEYLPGMEQIESDVREQVMSHMNAYDASTSYQSVMTWWKMAYMAAIATTGVLFVGMCAAYVVCYQKSRKENG